MGLDHFYLHQAYQLALENEGGTSPNPPVGALVVKDGVVAGYGSHVRAGMPHAEAIALATAGGSAAGATLYCSLEPCAHFGKTPPCTAAISSARIARVVYGARDRNPLVNGKGDEALARSGIRVEQLPMGVIQDFYRPFFAGFELQRPYVIAKAAMTANGMIAPADRNSRWITRELARTWVHHLRAVCDGIVIGAGTVTLDRPQLTVRMTGTERKTLRILLDPRFKIPPDDCSLLQAPGVPLLVCGAADAPADKERVWRDRGIETLRFNGLPDLLSQLMNLGLRKILIEGGQRVFTMFHAAGLIDEYAIIISPRLLTGSHSLNMMAGSDQSLSESGTYATLPPLDLNGDVVLRFLNRKGAK